MNHTLSDNTLCKNFFPPKVHSIKISSSYLTCAQKSNSSLPQTGEHSNSVPTTQTTHQWDSSCRGDNPPEWGWRSSGSSTRQDRRRRTTDPCCSGTHRQGKVWGLTNLNTKHATWMMGKTILPMKSTQVQISQDSVEKVRPNKTKLQKNTGDKDLCFFFFYLCIPFSCKNSLLK